MAFRQLVSIIVTNAVLKFLRLIKKEREELAEVDESDIFDEAIVIERNEA
ncbi:Uncharacterised protein [Klebsiella pneumoniae]|nr:Uncharacterised protein [Klebsiella pneumoniae]